MNRNKVLNLTDRALEAHKAGRIEEAAAIYKQVCQAAPRFFDAWYLAGALAFQRGGHLPEAVQLLSRALRLNPQSAECKLFLGMALVDSGRHAEAEKPLKAAVQKLPGYAEAWEGLANVACALGRPVEAVEHLRRVVAMLPDRADVRQRLDQLLAEIEAPEGVAQSAMA